MPLPLAMIGVVAGAAGAATSVGGAIGGTLPTHRQCTIDITNGCGDYTLCDPRVYINRGSCSIPWPPTIATSTSASALFIKSPHAACGSVGVFTYDLVRNDTKRSTGRMAVMFSVPYDFSLYSNWYAVGIFDTSRGCDYDLYCQMYNNSADEFIRGKANGSSLHHEGQHVAVRATMSDTYQPVMRVEVTETCHEKVTAAT